MDREELTTWSGVSVEQSTCFWVAIEVGRVSGKIAFDVRKRISAREGLTAILYDWAELGVSSDGEAPLLEEIVGAYDNGRLAFSSPACSCISFRCIYDEKVC